MPEKDLNKQPTGDRQMTLTTQLQQPAYCVLNKKIIRKIKAVLNFST